MNNNSTAATNSTLFSDWMLLALEQAERAMAKGEAPIGSVLLREDRSVLADYSRKLFVDWMEKHEGDESRNAQRRFVSQLLTLKAS